MADVTIAGLSVTTTTPAADDLLGIWLVGAAQMAKVTKANLVGATFTGSGTVATGGFTLTVPATGTAALREAANIFIAPQTIQPGGTTDVGLNVNMPSGSGVVAQTWQLNGVTRAQIYVVATSTHFALAGFDNGSGIGPSFIADRNTNASTPASGNLRITNKNGSDYYIWVDANGRIRFSTSTPTFANDLAGSDVAVQNNSNLFASAQGIQPTLTNAIGLSINMPSATSAAAQDWRYDSAVRAQMYVSSSTTFLALAGFDNGTGIGPSVIVDRNSNASTPASGNLRITNGVGADYYIWVDAAAQLRIGTTGPTSAQDTSGTIVGAQSSMAAAKNISDVLPDPQESLRAIMDAAKTLRAFNYKSGSYNGEQFPTGIITDYAPRYGMDRSEDAPQGKSLNVAVAIGDLIASVALLAERIGEDVLH